MPKIIAGYKEKARRRIIEAGFAVMSKKGLCDMTMDDISAYLGVSKGALYLYFKTKDDLVLEIIRTIHDDVVETAKVAFPSSTPLEAWTVMLDHHLTNESFGNSLYLEAIATATRNETIKESLSQKMMIWIESASRTIANQQSQGLVQQDTNPRTLAFAIVSIFLGFQNLAVAGVDRQEIRERWMALLHALSMNAHEQISPARVTMCPMVMEILMTEPESGEPVKIPECPADCQNFSKCKKRVNELAPLHNRK